MEIQAGQTHLWPLAVFFGTIILLVAFMLVSSYLLGARRRIGTGTAQPYESGIRPTGSSWAPFDVRYYLIALLFVIFDAEAIFVLAWAVSLRAGGWTGFIEMSVFTGTVLVALVYLWRMGALDWVVSGRTKAAGAEDLKLRPEVHRT